MKEVHGRDIENDFGDIVHISNIETADFEPSASAVEKGRLLRIEREQRILAQSAMSSSERDVQQEPEHQDEVPITNEVREIIDWFNDMVLDLRSKEDRYGAKVHSLQDAQRIAYNRLNIGFRTARLAAQNYDVSLLQKLNVDGAEVHTLKFHSQEDDSLYLDARQRAYKD